MATHSSILVWRISRTEEPGGLPSTGLQRIRHNWVTNTFTFFQVSLRVATKAMKEESTPPREGFHAQRRQNTQTSNFTIWIRGVFRPEDYLLLFLWGFTLGCQGERQATRLLLKGWGEAKAAPEVHVKEPTDLQDWPQILRALCWV